MGRLPFFVKQVLRPRPDASPRYLNYLLDALYANGGTVPFIKQSTGIQNLDVAAFMAQPVEAKGWRSQEAIADFLDAETSRIDTLVAKKGRMAGLLGERELTFISKVLVPDDRAFTRLGRLASIQSGVTVDGARSAESFFPYLRVANVQPGWLDLSEVKEIALSGVAAPGYMLRNGDVLMTEGGDIDKLGRGTVWRDEIPNCLHQNHIFAVRPMPERLDADYLALLTMTNHAREYFESTGSQTTNLASTNASKVLGFPIPVIPIEEQIRLVGSCSAVRERATLLREKLDRQIKLLSERRQALITAAVTGGLAIP